MNNEHIETLLEFLNTPLDSGDAVFDRFASLPGAVTGCGSEPLQRYVYIPGAREDRVVLVSHIDTIWDRAYGSAAAQEHPVVFENGAFRSGSPELGIGADDRAGCAMLWQLRSSGHSLLLLDGEEHGKRGARYLRSTNRRLFRELNRHCFMMELDWAGTNSCLFNQVDVTGKFRRFIEAQHFKDSHAKGGTDLQILCRHVCGVNIGVGYHNWHSPKEHLVLSEWENTLAALQKFLDAPQKKYRTKPLIFSKNFIKRVIKKFLHILRLK